MMLSAPRILIIGASSGIGREVALTYLRRGCRVGLAARSADALKAIADQFPDRAVWASIDVTSPDCSDAVNALIDRMGGTDIVFNAAGCGWYNPDLDTTDELRTTAVNVDGFTRVVDTAYHYFADHGHPGTIAAITSVAGVKGMGISAAYSATKRYQWTYLQAVDQLARMRHLQLKIVDIRPGFIHTALLDRGPAHLPMTMNPDRAAALVVKAIDRRRRITYIDWRWGILVRLWKLIPQSLWRRLNISFND